jgi:tRNA1Val (adenine37-N6)-methyltransferase
MLAQRTQENVLIEGVEIEERDAEQAKDNVLQSPWPNRVAIYHGSFQSFTSEHQYDLIVCNPPYFEKSLLPPHAARAHAKHAQSLTAEQLIEHSLRLLNERGRLSVILPTTEGSRFKAKAASHLHLIRETAFFSREEKPQERWLLEFSRVAIKTTSSRLVLYDSNDKKTKEYINLTEDFYL